jgi:hypothetical protein
MDFSESSFLRSQGLGWDDVSAVGGSGKFNKSYIEFR